MLVGGVPFWIGSECNTFGIRASGKIGFSFFPTPGKPFTVTVPM
ncbi:hypothetical protein bcgnr5414_65440 [Bacillus cereus]